MEWNCEPFFEVSKNYLKAKNVPETYIDTICHQFAIGTTLCILCIELQIICQINWKNKPQGTREIANDFWTAQTIINKHKNYVSSFDYPTRPYLLIFECSLQKFLKNLFLSNIPTTLSNKQTHRNTPHVTIHFLRLSGG